MIKRFQFTEDASLVALPTHQFKAQRHWFRTENQRREYMDHRNRLARAARAGVDTNNAEEYEAYALWEARGAEGRWLDDPTFRLQEIRDLLDSRQVSNDQFIMKVIEIFEREDHVRY